MTLHKSDAIVLKRDRSGESSLLVELFLKDRGRVNLLAKGARKPGSVMVGKLEQFSEIEVLYYSKTDDSLGVISQVNQKHTNSELSGDIRRLSYASAVVEALKDIVRQSEDQQKMFRLVSGTFYMMNYAPAKKLEFFFLVFLLKALDLIGLSPQFDRCVKSGREIESEEVLFSVEEGGIISREETSPDKSYLKIDQGMLKVMQKARASDIDKLQGLNFTDKQRDVIRDLLFAFLSYHADGRPTFKSLNFLTKLANY